MGKITSFEVLELIDGSNKYLYLYDNLFHNFLIDIPVSHANQQQRALNFKSPVSD